MNLKIVDDKFIHIEGLQYSSLCETPERKSIIVHKNEIINVWLERAWYDPLNTYIMRIYYGHNENENIFYTKIYNEYIEARVFMLNLVENLLRDNEKAIRLKKLKKVKEIIPWSYKTNIIIRTDDEDRNI